LFQYLGHLFIFLRSRTQVSVSLYTCNSDDLLRSKKSKTWYDLLWKQLHDDGNNTNEDRKNQPIRLF